MARVRMNTRLTRNMVEHLKSIWNLAHEPRRRGAAIVRCLRGGHYENARVHDAILRRGLIRESRRHGYARLTAAGMRALGVKATDWRWLP